MRSESELNHLAINNSNNSKTKNLLGKLMKALAHPIIQKKPNHLNSTALSFIIDISPVSNAAPSSGIPLTMTAQNGFTKLEEPIKYAPCKTCQELNLFCPNTNEYVRPAYNSNHSSMSTAIFYGNAFRNWFEEIYFPNGTEFDSSVNSCSTLTIMNHSHKRDSVVSARSDFDRDIEAEAESFIHRSEKLCLAIEARLSDLSPHNVNSPKMVSEDSATTFTETMSILRQKHLTI
ncbi:hypothetical protein BDF20DRAFT_883057 [Mycotypha africana]|uniref:uncharacterized protein n=1 Tax=Mycotypha africana TaxID=64632 RepID=UPI0023004F5C|nr:uncharacterized protein BDF20DRAFT_883057 [Mycotypha africana]KAI8973560.1 hypothetical protein BDF20DRAFT_883057 [Mycotypha africana]